MKRLNNIIPDCIKEEITKATRIKEKSVHVYRVAKSGLINEDTFDSTYEEVLKGVIPNNHDLNDIGTYSTSVFKDKQKCIKFLHLQKRKYSPPACLIEGNTAYGLVQESENKNDSHIHWWIYEGCKFNLVEEQCFSIYNDGDD